MWFAETTGGGGPGQGPSSGPPIRIGHALSEGGINPDMVAFSFGSEAGQRQTVEQRLSTSDKTTAKVKPRDGTTAAWLEELYELIAKHRCSKVINTFGPPSVDDLHRTFPTLDMAALQQAFASLHREWWIQATIVYGIVRRSIDLSGPYESTDIEYLREHFHRGDDRHGPELLRWVRRGNAPRTFFQKPGWP